MRVEAGIRQDMAVVNAQGVVGLVSAVSEDFALVLPVINTSSHLSVKVRGSNHRGQLIWNGGSPRSALVTDIPEHAVVEIGDTIVTSGAPAFFPEGITVGFVEALSPTAMAASITLASNSPSILTRSMTFRS